MEVSLAIQIREATQDDINIIHQLAHEIWPITYQRLLSADQLEYMLDLIYSESSLKKQFDADHNFLIVEEDKYPVAFADYGLLKDDVYKLHKIYVLPNQQGKSIGKILISYVINAVKKQNASALLLNVKRDNKAKYFYEHLGFKVISEEDIDIGNGYILHDYIMSYKL